MGREAYTYWTSTCNGGINEQEQLIRKHQVLEALNVWAPDGNVKSRPGYTGVATIAGYQVGTANASNVHGYQDVSSGTILITAASNNLTLSNLVARQVGVAGDYWYVGWFLNPGTLLAVGAQIDIVSTNSNLISMKLEYWNGTSWKYLPCEELVETVTTGSGIITNIYSYTRETGHLNTSTPAGGEHRFAFVTPKDWTQSILIDTASATSYTKYWMRISPIEGTDTTFDASTVIDNTVIATSLSRTRGCFPVQFPTNKRYVSVLSYFTASIQKLFLFNSSTVGLADSYTYELPAKIDRGEPASFAVIPEFGEVYLAYDHQSYVLKAFPTATDSILATVEDRNYLVGDSEIYSSAYFDKNLIAQEEEWPAAKYTMFFKGILWAANLRSNPYAVQWSGPVPFYKVWPSLQIEKLMEDDNSPITGLNALNEYPVIFKNDSIWNMTYLGQDEDNLTSWAPIRVVAGTGCVSNSSVQKIRGRLIFLAEDGIYAYNGTPQIQKVVEDPVTRANRLAKIVSRITPGHRSFAVAAHWKTKSAYLLAVSLDGNEYNNHVIVWDYKNDTWWLWDNIQAESWIVDEDAADNEVIFFVDAYARVFQLGVGRNDRGEAIESHILTQRVGYDNYRKFTPRVVRLSSSADTRSVSVEIRANDETVSPVTGTVSLTDPTEKDWDDFTFGTDNYACHRLRKRNLYVRKGLTCDWFHMKVSHNTKDQEFTLDQVSVGMVGHGRR